MNVILVSTNNLGIMLFFFCIHVKCMALWDGHFQAKAKEHKHVSSHFYNNKL